MTSNPILIVGSGVSGLLLAQYLRKTGRPFQIFERDMDLATRGLGWGLTLHWSLPALRSLLPDDLVLRLPEAYVDRAAVEQGKASTFPFFDLSTGELKASTPKASTDTRIRVSRDKFRRLLATGLEIQWNRAAKRFETHSDGSVTVYFDDGSSSQGSMIVACDGGNSRIRRHLIPGQENYQIPVRLIGVKLNVTPEEVEPLRQLDPYFLQGTASQNDSYLYFSVLDAPSNDGDNSNSDQGTYSCQVIVSWPVRGGFFGSPSPIPVPDTDEGCLLLMKRFASTWADPFRSLILSIPAETEIKRLNLSDWPPPSNLRTSGSVALIGDALHPMAMYRGEGANHAIVDVLDFVEMVVPHLTGDGLRDGAVRSALDRYEDKVVARARPAVFASRQACLDAHNWRHINSQSPLLTKRTMNVEFNETNTDHVERLE
ncbi:FAD/NAD(P)-binding domain-containing protein [Coniochaeta sp. PMI_546]|nr:FAD/NAD(P)-binding domain-containing protein [Coniochaeta sp. PMI_546]